MKTQSKRKRLSGPRRTRSAREPITQIVAAFVMAAIIYKLIWDNYTAIQGSWYGPLVAGGLLISIYYILGQ